MMQRLGGLLSRVSTSLLVAMLGQPDRDAQMRASTSLWRMVEDNAENRKTIAAAGDAADLVALLREGSGAAKDYALWSLSLSIDECNQQVILDHAGEAHLVRRLEADDQITRAQAAAADADARRCARSAVEQHD